MIDRTLRKGDRISQKEGHIYTVLSDESDGGKVRAELTEQPEEGYNERGDKYWAGPYKLEGDNIRKYWTMVEEGPAKRPNNRVTKTRAGSVRLGEKVRVFGVEAMVEWLEFVGVMVRVHYKDGEESKAIWLDMEEPVEVLGKRGRPLPSTVHYNPFTELGKVVVQRNWRPGFGSFDCGVVTNIDVFASSPELVTCTQRCAEKARLDNGRYARKS